MCFVFLCKSNNIIDDLKCKFFTIALLFIYTSVARIDVDWTFLFRVFCVTNGKLGMCRNNRILSDSLLGCVFYI